MSGLLKTRSSSFRDVGAKSHSQPRGVAHTLEQDGVVLSFFHAVVRMNRRSGAALAQPEQRHQCPLPIPDTVVYERNFPQGWFSYDHRDKVLVQRPGKALDAGSIFEAFRHAESSSGGICAQFVATQWNNQKGTQPASTDAAELRTSKSPRGFGSARNLLDFVPPQPTESHDLCVEFFNAETLAEFVFGRGVYAQRQKHGILQIFIPPRASNNDALEVIWSPWSCGVSRCVNAVGVNARTSDVRLKGSTLDGPPHLCETTNANPLLRRELKSAASHLAQYLLRHEHKLISRMVLVCKQDPHGVLWLLYATSIRTSVAHDVVAAKKPRVPLNLTTGFNFTSDLRIEHGTSADQLEVALAQHVDMGYTSPSSVIAYRSPSADGTSRRRIVGYRIESSTGDGSPQITGMSLAQCCTPSPPRSTRGSRRPSSAAASPKVQPEPLSAGARAREIMHNLVYQLNEARHWNMGDKLPHATALEPSAEVVGCLGREHALLLYSDALDLSLDDEGRLVDRIMTAAHEAANRVLRSDRGRRGQLLLRLVVQDELRKAQPVGRALALIDAALL